MAALMSPVLEHRGESLSFNSIPYLFIFLPLVVIGYSFVNRPSLAYLSKAYLLLVSLLFYAYGSHQFVWWMLTTILINFLCGIPFQKCDQAGSMYYSDAIRKVVLTSGIGANLAFLGFFKYADFTIVNLNWMLNTHIPLLKMALPLAISFFTFQQIAYLVDCYRGVSGTKNLLVYGLFVTFFPQLMSGPIVRYNQMMPQFDQKKHYRVDWDNLATGLFIFSMGLFKKMVIAEVFSVWAGHTLNPDQTLTLGQAWGISLGYTFQLYYDFCGYTDMAIGAALMCNIRLPINFDSPYKAINIQDFWRRWHITLSNWLRDYLYIPLGGNRKGRVRTYVNLIITFLLGGLWHGASWNFVIWGAMHGCALAIHRLWRDLGMTLPRILAYSITFLFINVAWVFFYFSSLEKALYVLKAMMGLNGAWDLNGSLFSTIAWEKLPLVRLCCDNRVDYLLHISSVEYALLFGLLTFLMPNSTQMIGFVAYEGRFVFRPNTRFALLAAVLFCLSLLTFLGGVAPGEFIYFNS